MIKAAWEHDYYKDCIPNFNENLSKPRHRWYEFKEGYSDAFVLRAIKHHDLNAKYKSSLILDPFSGSGTTPLTGVQNGYDAIAVEVNPFMSFISEIKCKACDASTSQLEKELAKIMNAYPLEIECELEGYSTFSPDGKKTKWLFNRSVLRGFEALKTHIKMYCSEDYQGFFNIALYSAVMECCNARRDGKCLRYKKSWETAAYSSAELRNIFFANAKVIIEDISVIPLNNNQAKIINGDSRQALKQINSNIVDVVAFSPPYLNSFDYSDVYRPELFMGGFVKNNEELRELRSKTLRSHVQYKWIKNGVCTSDWVANIVSQVSARESYLWDKNIPDMINNYFIDMEEIFKECYRVSRTGATMWFIVSTSAYAGIEIPVDLILADLATKHGWELESVNALRNLRTSSQCSDENIRKVRLRESMVACRKV